MTKEIAEYIDILRVLSKEAVEFVVIGQVAASLHGSAIPTFDIDICYQRSPDTIRKLVTALRRMHTKLRVGRSDDGEDLPFILDERSIQSGGNFTFDTDYGPLDCLAWPTGVNGYEELVESAEEFEVEDLRISAASVDHILVMRRKAGRRKDLERIDELEEIKRIQEERGRKN